MREWYAGLDAPARRLTAVLLAVCLACLPVYVVGIWHLNARSAHTQDVPVASETVAPAGSAPSMAEPTSTPVPLLSSPSGRELPVQLAPPAAPFRAPPGDGAKKQGNQGRGEKDHGRGAR